MLRLHLSRRPVGVAIRIVSLAALLTSLAPGLSGAPVHTTYLWHMHQPIYWPDRSTWYPSRYETAYETITLGHSESDVYAIFDKEDRVHDYQNYPRDAIASVLDIPDAGAQISFAGSLIEVPQQPVLLTTKVTR